MGAAAARAFVSTGHIISQRPRAIGRETVSTLTVSSFADMSVNSPWPTPIDNSSQPCATPSDLCSRSSRTAETKVVTIMQPVAADFSAMEIRLVNDCDFDAGIKSCVEGTRDNQSESFLFVYFSTCNRSLAAAFGVCMA